MPRILNPHLPYEKDWRERRMYVTTNAHGTFVQRSRYPVHHPNPEQLQATTRIADLMPLWQTITEDDWYWWWFFQRIVYIPDPQQGPERLNSRTAFLRNNARLLHLGLPPILGWWNDDIQPETPAATVTPGAGSITVEWTPSAFPSHMAEVWTQTLFGSVRKPNWKHATREGLTTALSEQLTLNSIPAGRVAVWLRLVDTRDGDVTLLTTPVVVEVT